MRAVRSADAEAMTTEAVLRDGTVVRIRPVHGDDGARLVAFHSRLSPESQRLRFFSPHPNLSEREVSRFVNVDGDRRVALVAERGGDIVAVARFDRIAGTADAEAAFVVQDDMQGRGLGTVLLARLAETARRHDLRRLVAQTLPENRRMLHVFRRYADDVTTSFRNGVIEVEIPLGAESERG